MRFPLKASLLLTFGVAAFGQTHTGEGYRSEVKGSRTAITLRVQRQERYTSACAVVYPNDKVHDEVRAMNGMVVYEGVLPPESAAQVHATLPALQQIDPETIQQKTRIEDVDIVLINVAVPRGILNLHFADASTRKPYKDSIDPLLKWLGSLGHQHLRQLSDAKPTNCLPDDSFDPGASNAPKPITTAIARQLSETMLLRVQMFGMDDGVSRERCILILPGGQYRYEDQMVGSDDRRTTKVYAGALEGDDTAEVKKILNDPAIRDAQHTAETPNGISASEIESIELTIPRADHVQRLNYYSFTGRQTMYADANVATDLDDRVMRPLSNFLRSTIIKRKGATPIPGAAPNHCSSY